MCTSGGIFRLIKSSRQMLSISFVLLLVLNFARNGLPVSLNSECVIATKQSDGSFDFSLEINSSSSHQWKEHRLDYDFIIPAAVWFGNNIDSIGWALQTVKTSGDITDTIQAYWAGYLETHISLQLTRAHFENTWAGFCKDKSSEKCSRLRIALVANLRSTIQRSLKMCDIDAYWHQMELILWQLRGMVDSWNNRVVLNSKELTDDYLYELTRDVFTIYLLQLSGDMGEIMQAVGVYEELKQWEHRGRLYRVSPPTCSALIKVLPNQKDIFVSHVTWQGYTGMLKVMKYYEFAWHTTKNSAAPLIPADQIVFSSYPSTVGSIDDFYVASTGLVTLETTTGNYNSELWPVVLHGLENAVLEVFRVMIANRLARTSQEWTSYFSRDNSGTYNNQWMILDTKKFKPNNPLPDKDLLWVSEQIPGHIQSADVTHVLKRQSYWASYNLPYFDFIYNTSGFPQKVKEYGDWFNYKLNPRAQIFHRNHSLVNSLDAMYRLMRYNNFKKDPLSHCNCSPPYSAENAISARNDLNDPKGSYPFGALSYRLHGGTDVKLVNWALAKNLSVLAVSGPTYDEVPVFEWSSLKPPVPRPFMHPDRWAFQPVLLEVNRFDDSISVPHIIAHGIP